MSVLYEKVMFLMDAAIKEHIIVEEKKIIIAYAIFLWE